MSTGSDDSASARPPVFMAQSIRVIVGIDEHPASMSALRFAATEAAFRGGEVLAIHVWRRSGPWGRPDVRPVGGPDDEHARDRLNETVGTLLRERELHDEPLVRIVTEVVRGDAGAELTQAATGAAMLVLGQRHHSRILGSVSQASINGAPCVVVIVPDVPVES